MRVREYREAKGYTQSYMAEKLGITQASYSYKEKGERPFWDEELLMLEVLLDTTVSEMFKDKKNKIEKELNKKGE